MISRTCVIPTISTYDWCKADHYEYIECRRIVTLFCFLSISSDDSTTWFDRINKNDGVMTRDYNVKNATINLLFYQPKSRCSSLFPNVQIVFSFIFVSNEMI